MVDQLPQVPPLPQDAICLHIGVHKTGTTALQSALAQSRDDLARAGVVYPGRRTAHHGAATSAIGRTWGWRGRGGQAPNPAVFDRLARQARNHPGRVVISSEQFCEADDEAAARIVAGLGSDRTHVVVTVRSLGRLLPSSWQQYLKYGQTMAYEKWLRTILDPDYDGRVTPTFWRRNDHGRLVRRWADLLGPDRVTVLVVDDVGPDALFTAIAQMLDVPAEVLLSRRDDAPNRSMTAAESELLRRLNRALAKSLSWQDYETLVRGGVASALQTREPDAGEPRLHTPQWALDAATARGQQAVTAIRESGVQVVGDLDALARPLQASPTLPPGTLGALPMDAALAVVGAQVRNQAGTAGQSGTGRARQAASRAKWAVAGALSRR